MVFQSIFVLVFDFVCWALSLSLIVEKKQFSSSMTSCESLIVLPSNSISSGILDVDDLPFRSLICHHKYALSLFSEIDFEKKSLFAERIRDVD